jgi:hypothetical protein
MTWKKLLRNLHIRGLFGNGEKKVSVDDEVR